MSSLVRVKRRQYPPTLARAVAAFLREHDLSPSSQRVDASTLRDLKDGLGGDTALTTLDEPDATEQLAVWFRTRYQHTAPATRVRQLAILRSACAFWRKHAWIAADPTVGLERPKSRSTGPGH